MNKKKKRTSTGTKVPSRLEVDKKKINGDGRLPVNERKVWDKAEVDVLLEMYFIEEPWIKICRCLQRSEKSVKSKLWKVLSQYANEIYSPDQYCEYRTQKAADRAWTNAELSTLNDIKGTWALEDICTLFQRSSADVSAVIEKMRYAPPRRPTLFNLDSGDFKPTEVIPLPPEEVEKMKKSAAEIQSLEQEDKAPTNTKKAHAKITQHEGKKYLRVIHPADGEGKPIRVDVYAVLEAFRVPLHSVGHAVKKLLCAGLRDKGSMREDLVGAIAAINRAIERLDEIEEESNGS